MLTLEWADLVAVMIFPLFLPCTEGRQIFRRIARDSIIQCSDERLMNGRST